MTQSESRTPFEDHPVPADGLTWAPLITFLGFTYAWSAVFMTQAVTTGEITVVTALGGMWGPFVALLVTRLLYPEAGRRGNLSGLGWRWGQTRWQVWSYALPAVYVGVAYGVVWALGLGIFSGTSPVGLLQTIALGTLLNSVAAFGEEIGWQGYLVPRLYAAFGFTRSALLRGVIWSVWHYPLIVGGVYGPSDAPLSFKLTCFTITLTGVSFAFTWLRIRSGSLWTGVFLHATHNLCLQAVFPSMTAETPTTHYFVGEFGLLSAAAALAVAFVCWRKRGSLPHQTPAIDEGPTSSGGNGSVA